MTVPTWVILVISAVTDFLISGGGVLTGAMVANGAVTWPTPAVWLFATIIGLVAAGKEMRAVLKLGPVPDAKP